MELQDRMRADLVAALKDRNPTIVSVLRTTLAAIANAEAPPLAEVGRSPVVGRPNEVPRLALTDGDLERIVRAEIADRLDTIDRYERAGADEPAAALRPEIEILQRYLA
jgi:uncharacterized protein YqeY